MPATHSTGYTEGDAVVEFRIRTSLGGLEEGYDVLIIYGAQEYLYSALSFFFSCRRFYDMIHVLDYGGI